jgi:hypothetical protein
LASIQNRNIKTDKRTGFLSAFVKLAEIPTIKEIYGEKGFNSILKIAGAVVFLMTISGLFGSEGWIPTGPKLYYDMMSTIFNKDTRWLTDNTLLERLSNFTPQELDNIFKLMTFYIGK